MEELNKGTSHHQKMTMINRKNCSISGIKEMVSFDLSEIIMETTMGLLMIKGKNLHVKRLDLERQEVDLEGKIDSLVYEDHKTSSSKEGFFHRLWK